MSDNNDMPGDDEREDVQAEQSQSEQPQDKQNGQAETGPAELSPREKARKYIFTAAIIFGVWSLLRGVTGLLVPPIPEHPVQLEKTQVIAHRGGAGEFPEETMFAFRESAKLGVDAFELDVHLSADGQLVIIHDDDVYRTTSGEGPVSSYTLSDLKGFDAAYWWPAGRKEDCEACFLIPDDEFPYRGKGLKIPALEELLTEFPDKVKIIEMKGEDPAIVDALGTMLSEYHQENRAIVASFSDENLKAFRERYPEFATSAGEKEVRTFYILNTIGFATAYKSPAEFFQVPVKQGSLTVITPRFIQSAKEDNITVQAWTINDRAEMRRLLDMGVDGIITDEPSTLLDVLGR